MGIGEVSTVLFLMLGPLKIIAPFAKLAAQADEAFRRRLALRAFLISCVAILAALTLGAAVLEKWRISVPALLITNGIVLFIVALRGVLRQYEPQSIPEGPAPVPTLEMAVTPLAFPTIVTPYGIAAVILVITLSPGRSYTLEVLAVILAILAIDLLAMLYCRQILGLVGVLTLRILGTVLGILQVGLAVQIILQALSRLGWIPVSLH